MSHITLDAEEARVLGVLLEKEVTTPDVYPLSINAALGGCNQKSNREPVMTLVEGQVRDALERLVTKTLVREQGSAGGRTRRFAHRMDSRLFGTLQFSRDERAVLCVLLLRGPQTPGEIRNRSGRLATFADVPALEAVLTRLAGREDGPHVEALAREPGRRELRWRQLFTPAPQGAEPAPLTTPRPAAVSAPGGGAGPPGGTGSGDSLDALAERLAAMEERLDGLEALLARLAPAGGPPDDPAP